MSIELDTRISFFKADRYTWRDRYVFNTASAPRPHFCLGLITEGRCTIEDCETGKITELSRGDLIFVPMGSRYIAIWQGEPEVSYISLHFVFEYPAIYSGEHSFRLARVSPPNADEYLGNFEFILNNYTAGAVSSLASAGKLMSMLGELLPLFPTRGEHRIDRRIRKAIEYIEKNYNANTSVAELAQISNMSTSRFFASFRVETGFTPTEYINKVRINRAIILMYDKSLSAEEISWRVGYNSSVYFRRVFKKMTGKTPREYKKTALEVGL